MADVDVKNFNPYMAIIGPHSESVDYSKLKSSKVSAMMFNAGSMYSASHKKNTHYKNPYLSKQIKKCMKVNLPYALYAIIRAHDITEADAECRALYYILAEYTPKLGIWLYLDTNQNVETNNAIIDVYYRYIRSWGFTDRCGIYTKISDLSKFSWDEFQEDFYLLGIDTSISLSKVEGQLLDPSMFEVKQ